MYGEKYALIGKITNIEQIQCYLNLHKNEYFSEKLENCDFVDVEKLNKFFFEKCRQKKHCEVAIGLVFRFHLDS